MQERLERQREFSMAMSMAIGSLFDPKVGKDANQAIERAVKAIVEQQEGLYGLNEFARTGQRKITREEKQQQDEKKDESGLSKKQVQTWKDAGKIDVLMSKMTGRPTGAIWSNVNEGTLQMDGDALSGRVESQTGDQIVSKMRGFHERMRGSVRAGPRRRR